MQVIQFLHTTFAAALPQVHATRLRAVLDAVAAALSGAPLSLTGLGRCLPSSALVKHAIKRVDRLLGNRHLQGERGAFYACLLHALLRRVLGADSAGGLVACRCAQAAVYLARQPRRRGAQRAAVRSGP